jgi:hypothetical protein
MPLGLDFYTVLALAAALLLGFTALIRQIRDPHGADLRWARATLHFILPLLLALSVLLPPYDFVLPFLPTPIYFWQIGLLIGIVVLVRNIPRSTPPGAGRPWALYTGAVLYVLALLISLVYDDKATIMTLISFGLLLHLFAGVRTLMPAAVPAAPPVAEPPAAPVPSPPPGG